jgi:ATP-binding cassette subfamily B protein
MGLVTLVSGVLGSVNGYIRTALGEQVRDKMHVMIHAKALSLDMQFFESPTYYDQLQRASVDAIDRPIGLLDSISKLLQNTITLVAMAGVLLTFAWWLPIVLLLGTLPALWVALQSTVEFHRWRVRNTINERRLHSTTTSLIHDEAAPEMRLFDLGDHFSIGLQFTLRGRLRNERLHLACASRPSARSLRSLAGLLTMSAALIWIAWQALQGYYNLGDMAMLFQAMSQGQALMQSLLAGAGEIYRNLLFLEDLFTFLELEAGDTRPCRSRCHRPERPARRHRPGGHHLSLSHTATASPCIDFNLTIPAGRSSPSSARMARARARCSSCSAASMIRSRAPSPGMGWICAPCASRICAGASACCFSSRKPTTRTSPPTLRLATSTAQPTQEEIERAAEGSGAAGIIGKLPQGYDTVLGKWFGYTQLSTGEWQRLALARAFIRKADLVILDEPTSAMDSWAENDWMNRFRSLVEVAHCAHHHPPLHHGDAGRRHPRHARRGSDRGIRHPRRVGGAGRALRTLMAAADARGGRARGRAARTGLRLRWILCRSGCCR